MNLSRSTGTHDPTTLIVSGERDATRVSYPDLARWFVPLPGLRPEDADLHHLHAAVSHWFDRSDPEHDLSDKAWTLGPPIDAVGRARWRYFDGPVILHRSGVTGIEVSCLIVGASDRLWEMFVQGPIVRIGPQTSPMGRPRLMHGTSWPKLAVSTPQRRWQLFFASPVTFRRGRHTSPLPDLRALFSALLRTWQQPWVPTPPSAVWDGSATQTMGVLQATNDATVSAVELSTAIFPLVVLDPRGRRTTLDVNAAHGWMQIEIHSHAAARVLSPLLRLAEYAGVGGFTPKGFGVTRVRALRIGPGD